MCVCLPGCMCTTSLQMPWEPEEGVRDLWTGVTGSCALSSVDSGNRTVEEQRILLTWAIFPAPTLRSYLALSLDVTGTFHRLQSMRHDGLQGIVIESILLPLHPHIYFAVLQQPLPGFSALESPVNLRKLIKCMAPTIFWCNWYVCLWCTGDSGSSLDDVNAQPAKSVNCFFRGFENKASAILHITLENIVVLGRHYFCQHEITFNFEGL